MSTDIDRSATSTTNFWQFQPMETSAPGQPLESLEFAPDDELLVVTRNGEHLGLVMRQMAYHHVAQGQLGGVPYLVTF